MTIKTTSWQAYQDILRGGVAFTDAQRVLQALNYKTDGATRNQLAAALGMGINSICGRVNELLKADVIYVDGTTICPISGRNVEKLKVVSYE